MLQFINISTEALLCSVAESDQNRNFYSGSRIPITEFGSECGLFFKVRVEPFKNSADLV